MSLESVEQALVDLANAVRETVQEAQRKAETLEAENHDMHAIVTAARQVVGDGGGWFFRVAVPQEQMESLTSALSDYKGRG
jgi:hypothetical protein